MKDFFRDKFEYNHASNKKVIGIMKEFPDACSDKALELISHTLNAQYFWNLRILGKKPSKAVWQIHEIDNLKNFNTECHNETLSIIERLKLSDTISYMNTKGQSFSNTVEDILFHVVNHGTYHRGQIMNDLKLNGAVPLGTDFIFHKR